tara:strand:+ start:15 stop:221 length:207 start_codon:yes stop_codon:yes gene_type:complete
MSDFNTVQIEDLEQFSHHTAKGMMPHKAIELMIEHKQKLDDTLMYLEFMVSDIKMYKANGGNSGNKSN